MFDHTLVSNRRNGNHGAPDRAVIPLRSAVLFEEFPELIRGLRPQAAEDVRSIRAPVAVLERGAWAPPAPRGEAHAHFGLLILEGALLRRVRLGSRSGGELLGCGDLVHPWIHESPYDTVAAEAGWQVLDRTRAAVLDARFAARIAPWPEIAAALITRATERARMLAFQHVASHIPGLDGRLLALMWAFADRWGRVTPDGILIRLRLTHATLAELAGASRPSVSTALTRLASAGALTRTPTGWLLDRNAPCEGAVGADDGMSAPVHGRLAGSRVS